MFLIQRLFADRKFFAPPGLRYWTADASKAVRFVNEQLAEEQAKRLPFVTQTIPALNVPQDSNR